ncbi:MAG: hypothetical protein KAJ14_08520 [Candidatus Omnitrophica bacterium]|nr:hypothetical protein [Candidatus Omnitrophota bacterium]
MRNVDIAFRDSLIIQTNDSYDITTSLDIFMILKLNYVDDAYAVNSRSVIKS